MNSTPLSTDEINIKIELLPQFLQNKISSYTSNQKKQQRLEGIDLLTTALRNNQMDENYIHSIYYNDYGKPFISNDFDFSLSYSQTIIVLGCIKRGFIGVDIEGVKPIDCFIYKDYFTTKEWAFLTHNAFSPTTFFQLWTRKEAVVKAIGKGAFIDFNLIEVLEDSITIDTILFKLTTEFFEGYCLSVASCEK